MAVTIIEAARLLWCPKLAQITINPKGDIREWLSAATYAPSVTGKDIILSGINDRDFLLALASDINRTAMAASETLRNITEITALPKSMAWPYVKLYYASLFYAHSLLRLWGRFPTYFRTSDLLKLRETCASYSISPPFKLQTGQFLLKADIAQSQLTISSDNGGGGTHEAVWREFNKALTELLAQVKKAPYLTVDKDMIICDIASIQSVSSKASSNTSWLSFMRNEIQYRQGEGVWYPYKNKDKTALLQSKIIEICEGSLDLKDILKQSGDELSNFKLSCFSIILFVRGVVEDMIDVGGPKSFLKHGQRKFEDAIA